MPKNIGRKSLHPSLENKLIRKTKQTHRIKNWKSKFNPFYRGDNKTFETIKVTTLPEYREIRTDGLVKK